MRSLKHRIKGFEESISKLFSKTIANYNEPAKEKDMGDMKMASGQGKMETNQFGGKRESNAGRGRFDLIPYEGLEEVAKWFEAGAEKYGDRNWEKGMSIQDTANRMVRHSMKAANGWMDEGPFAHFCAVAWAALTSITLIKRYPYTNDLFREAYLKALNLPEVPNNECIKPVELNDLEKKIYNNGIFSTVPTPTAEDIIRDIERLSTSESPSDFDTSSLSWEHFGKPFAKVSEIDFSEFPHGITIALKFNYQKDVVDFRRYLDRLRKIKIREEKSKK